MSTAYNHAAKAGNAADVWKHFVLMTEVESLLREDGRRPFRYFESHCGRGQYRLRRGGAWRLGIGPRRPAG